MTVSPIGGTAKRQRKTRKPVKGAAVSLRLTEEDGLLLNLCAEQLGVNKSELVRQLLHQHVAQLGLGSA